MSLKNQLALLYGKNDLPLDVYRTLPGFQEIEKEIDIVKKLDSFGLPEVSKIICCSDFYISLPWTEKYQNVRALYQYPDKIDARQVLSSFPDCDDFEKNILSVADYTILYKLKSHFEGLIRELMEQKESNPNKRSTLTRKINLLKERLKSVEDGEAETIKIEQEALRHDKSQLESEYTDICRQIKQYSEYITLTNEYFGKIIAADEFIGLQREAAYELLDTLDVLPEEDFLNRFLENGQISETDKKALRDQRFLENLLSLLDDENYACYAMPLIANLYTLGAIDLSEQIFSSFIDNHNSLLCEFLVKHIPDSVESLMESDLELFFEKALDIEISRSITDVPALFSSVWNVLTSTEVWKWVLQRLSELTEININYALCTILNGLSGQALEALFSTLSDTEYSVNYDYFEISSILVRSESMYCKHAILKVIEQINLMHRKIRRKLNTAERINKAQCLELFSSLYLPLSELEELTINLKISQENIKNAIIASHLSDIVVEIREGLEKFDLMPLEETENWSKQLSVQFNPVIHRSISKELEEKESVKLKTLGFEYVDDEGEKKTFNAIAYKPIPKNNVLHQRVSHGLKSKPKISKKPKVRKKPEKRRK